LRVALSSNNCNFVSTKKKTTTWGVRGVLSKDKRLHHACTYFVGARWTIVALAELFLLRGMHLKTAYSVKCLIVITGIIIINALITVSDASPNCYRGTLHNWNL